MLDPLNSAYAMGQIQGNMLFEQVFMAEDGTEIVYFYGEDGNTYTYNNNEVMAVALPLEQFKVTNQSEIDALEARRLNNRSIYFSPYTPDINNAYSIANGDAEHPSSTYLHYVDFSLGQYDMVALQINPVHRVVRLRTTNIEKNMIFTMSKINYRIYYYETATHYWYHMDFEGVDCTYSTGAGVEFVAGVNSYVSYSITAYSDLASCIAHVWTTPIGYY